jgi:hypothetical protein
VQYFLVEKESYVIVEELANPGLWHDAHRFDYEIVPCGHVEFVSAKDTKGPPWYMVCKEKQKRDLTADVKRTHERLKEIISLEGQKPINVLASYILGATLLDDADLYSDHPIIQRIGDLASDIEIRNSGSEWTQTNWTELKTLVNQLGKDYE